jgi:putative transposase
MGMNTVVAKATLKKSITKKVLSTILCDKIESCVAVSPNYTSQDCSSCGHLVKKSLSTRTHSCAHCGIEICRDTNAAINILKKGMGILGMEWQNSTFGQKESAEQSGKHGEKTTSTIDGQPEIASGLL